MYNSIIVTKFPTKIVSFLEIRKIRRGLGGDF